MPLNVLLSGLVIKFIVDIFVNALIVVWL